MSAPGQPVVDRSSLTRVRTVLADRIVREQGNQLYAKCPAHEDHDPSLSITWRDDSAKGGSVLLQCHAGCSTDDVVAAAGLKFSDLFDTPPGRPANGTATGPRAAGRVASHRPAASTGAAAKRSAADIEATYRYDNADGSEAYTIVRWKVGAKFSVRHPDPNRPGGWAPGGPNREGKVLYRLPQVLAAREAGHQVWVVEGEKDTDSLNAYFAANRLNAVATTAPFGAGSEPGKKWLPQYTAALEGAHVVIVHDNDQPKGKDPKTDYAGQRYALAVLAALEGTVESVRLVRAAAGKDATDHLEAGHGVDAFVDVNPAELAAMIAAHDDGTPLSGGNSSAPVAPPADPKPNQRKAKAKTPAARYTDVPGADDDELIDASQIVLRRDRFAIIGDGLYEVKWEGSGDARRQVAHELINVNPQLVRRLRFDMGDGETPRVTHRDLAVSREDETIVMEALNDEEWQKLAWAEELPWSVEYTDTANGRAKIRKGIMATSPVAPIRTLYGRLGWWDIDGQWVYLHAGGAITKDGPTDQYTVKVSPKYHPFTLPEPAANAAELREALTAGLFDPMEVLDDRLMAPMLAAAYRACLGWCRVTVAPTAPPGSGKTGLAAIAQQFYAPTARHHRMPFAAGEDQSTLASLEEHRFILGDMLTILDDAAPDKGTEALGRRLNQIARSQAERRGKDRRTRDMGTRAEHRPNGLLGMTLEQWVGIESAETRIVGLTMEKDAFDPHATFGPLDEGDGPMLRAKLAATMIQWAAPQMPMTDWLEDSRAKFHKTMMDDDAPDRGVEARRSDSFADLMCGVDALIKMASELKAITSEEASYWWARMFDGLMEAKTAMTAERETRRPATIAMELLRSAFVTKAVSVSDRTDNTAPPEADLYGWEKNDVQYGGWRRAGQNIGWADDHKLYLLPGPTTEVLAKEARGSSITWPYTNVSLGNMLADAGMLRVNDTKDGRRTAIPVRIGGKQIRVWELIKEAVYPEGDDGDQGAEPTGPNPEPEPTPAPPPGPAVLDTTPLRPARPAETPAEALEDTKQAESRQTPERPAQGRTAARRDPYGPYDAPALVCSAKGAWLALPEPRAVDLPDLPNDETALAELLHWATTTFRLGVKKLKPAGYDSYGQVWITEDLRKRLKLPNRLTRPETKDATKRAEKKEATEGKNHAKVRDMLTNGGWNVGGMGRIAEWTQIWRKGAGRTMLTVTSWMHEDPDHSLFGASNPEVSPATLARRIGLYAAAVGVAQQWTPASGGITILRATRPELHKHDRPEHPADICKPNLERPWFWQRAPQPDEAAMEWAILIDKRGAYVGGASALQLSYGALEEYPNGFVFDLEQHRNRGGFALVDVPVWDHTRLPDPLNRAADKPGPVWVAFPTLRGLVELYELDVKILKAWMWPAEETGRIFEPWYKAIRGPLLATEAVKYLEPGPERSKRLEKLKLRPEAAEHFAKAAKDDPDVAAVRAVVKGNYQAGIGRLDYDGIRNTAHRMWRPDWRAQFIAQSRFAIARDIMTAAEQYGRYPLAIATDAVLYAANDPDPRKGLPPNFKLDWGLGGFKHEGSARMADVDGLLRQGRTPVPTDPRTGRLGLMETLKTGGEMR